MGRAGPRAGRAAHRRRTRTAEGVLKVLITGIGGAHARRLALRLHAGGHDVCGIDRRPWPGAPEGVDVTIADIRKRPAADVFRRRRPDAVVHMATVTHFSTSREERLRINLNGTQAVFEHCDRFDVKAAVFVGRHTIYGAAPDAPLYRTEEEPPLSVTTFPELADLAAADLYAGSAIWRYPNLQTSVLRAVYALGPTARGTLANFLSGRRVPMVLGFDPLFQFMHDDDFSAAIAMAVEAKLRGVFNVAGPPPVPLSVLARGTRRSAVPLPEAILRRVLGRAGFPPLPKGAIAHLKHPVVVDDRRFRAETGFEHEFDERGVMLAFREALSGTGTSPHR